jgi:hypothetical protein
MADWVIQWLFEWFTGTKKFQNGREADSFPYTKKIRDQTRLDIESTSRVSTFCVEDSFDVAPEYRRNQKH